MALITSIVGFQLPFESCFSVQHAKNWVAAFHTYHVCKKYPGLQHATREDGQVFYDNQKETVTSFGPTVPENAERIVVLFMVRTT